MPATKKGLVCLAISGVAFVVPVAAQQASPATPTAVLDRYCKGCHNDRTKAAGFSVTTDTLKTPEDNPAAWEKIVTKLRHRYMPPVGLPRPDERTYEAVVASLETALDRHAAAHPSPGRTGTFRRLNRVEYQNTIRDLLAVEVDVSGLLPADESSRGFDNITVGGLSPTLLEKYLTAAQKISRLAIGSPVRSPGEQTIMLPPDLTQEDRLPGMPFGTRGGGSVEFIFPVDATYVIQLRLARDRDERVEGLNSTHRLDLTLDGKRLESFTISPVTRDELHHSLDRGLKVRVPVTAGRHQIAVNFFKKTSALIETERQPYLAHFNADRHPRTQPALYSISVAGPFEATGAGDTASRRRAFVCQPKTAAEEKPCAERILTKFLGRAYRRPVGAKDLGAPMEFFEQGRQEAGFESGIEMAIRAILVNPQFLFRIEKDPAGVPSGTPYPISDLELASRLSFFLWSSIPDDELLDVAARGKLRDSSVLEKQVHRMLADSRSSALVENFAAQWLYLRNLTAANPDPRLFPDFDDNLRQALRRETELFFQSIVQEDRNVVDLLSAKYTFLNERLARHYGIPNIYGSRFRRVPLDGDSVRGGILSQGSILTVTSYATRTSPVIRGKWILDNILGTPPAPPPPEIPLLKEAETVKGKPLTMRERVAQHRANPACASCHNLMDPLGFALETYDAVGRWRNLESGVPVDASGSLPNGTKFDGALQLQQALLKHPELFVSTLTEKLMTYALGRGTGHSDTPAIRRVVREAQKDDYRFSSLILGIARSIPFQMRSSL